VGVSESGRSKSTTAIAGLTPATLTVNKIENIVVTNTGSTAATVDVALCPAATFNGSLTALTYLAYAISVPPNAALVVTDKSTSFYLGDLQSIGFRSDRNYGYGNGFLLSDYRYQRRKCPFATRVGFSRYR